MSKFIECPRAYWYSYVQKVPYEAGTPLKRGSAYHNTLELMLQYKIDNKMEMVDPDTADRWAVKKAKEQGLSDSEIYRVIDAVRFYYQNLYELHTPVAVEQDFDIVRGGHRITGRIDLMDLMPSDRVAVVDHKFSYDTWAASRAKYGCQPIIYQWAYADQLKAEFGYDYGGFAYNIIRLYPSPKIQLIEIKPLNETKSAWWEEQIAIMAECMLSGLYPARSTDGNCTRCSYKKMCDPGVYDVVMTDLTGQRNKYEEDME